MKAMVLNSIGPLKDNPTPLTMLDIPIPEPQVGQLLIKISVCGVCHTELDEIEGRTPPSTLPMIPGHQVVGIVEKLGADVNLFTIGDRVGVAWIFSACGSCKFCLSEQENLCPSFSATGRDKPGGYAEYMTVDAKFAYPIPEYFSDAQAAPLLCAGAIGYRALKLTQIKDGQRLGLTGFGASGHLVLMLAQYLYPKSEIYVFARNPEERHFAEQLGAVWAGETQKQAPYKLHAIIDTTPAWEPIVCALGNLEAGGRLVINAIRKEIGQESLLSLDYAEHLWLEKEIKSVANITRADVSEFLQLAANMKLQPKYELFSLEQANQALADLKKGGICGAKVLKI